MNNIFITIIFIAIQAYIMPARAENEEKNGKNSKNSIVSTESAELAKIKQEKLAIESKYNLLDAACYKKFAVSNCLQVVKSDKLLALDEVKRRELEMNDQKRQLKAEAIIKKTTKMVEKKSEPNAISGVQKSEKSDRLENNLESPLAKNLSKLNEQRASAAQQRVLDSSHKQTASQLKAQSRAQKLNLADEQAAKFNEKISSAEQHRTIVNKSMEEKTKLKSATLPLPDLNPR